MVNEVDCIENSFKEVVGGAEPVRGRVWVAGLL